MAEVLFWAVPREEIIKFRVWEEAMKVFQFLGEVDTELGKGLVIGRMGGGKLLVAVRQETGGREQSVPGVKRMEAGKNMIMGWCEVCRKGYVGEVCGCGKEHSAMAERG